MRSTRSMIILVLMFMIVGPALADETLDRATTLDIVERLTSEGRETWIPAGTILAKHTEYRAARTTDSGEISKEIERQLADYRSDPRPEKTPELQKMRMEAIPFNVRYEMSNEHTMDSSVLVRYDGNRFYWEIEVDSRTDSVKVPSELVGNYMTEEFNLDWNQRRVIVWDGRNYTTYAGPVDRAMVDASGGFASSGVGGPLTAGVVPWGEGVLSSQNLSKARISTASVSRDGKAQVEMAVERADGASMYFVLDPAKDYAVTSCRLPSRDNTVMHNRYYSGYQQVAGNWVPTTVLIEQRDAFTNRLLNSDKWDFTVVDGSMPGPEAFRIDYTADTVVEYHSPLAAATATFNYSNLADTDGLLAERLTHVATKAKKPRNCATAALEHAAARLGKSIPDSLLARLVRPDGQTTLYDLKQAAKGLGLHCRAVAADIGTLRGLSDCVAILHLPAKNHFVVLDRVDDRYAWLVDLSSSRFYYRMSVDLMPLDWPEGTALLLSNRPIKAALKDLSDSTLASVVGAQDGWACTEVIQEWYYIPCTFTADGCTGYFRQFYLRYGCALSPGGSCPEGAYYRMVKCPCLSDPVQECALGEPIFYYIRACN